MLRKILKYRILIIQIAFILYKYVIIRHLLASKALLFYVTQNRLTNRKKTIWSKKQPYEIIISIANTMIRHLYPTGSCLVKSLVKRDILQKNGYQHSIALGVKSSESRIKAHAWLDNEKASNYNIVYLF